MYANAYTTPPAAVGDRSVIEVTHDCSCTNQQIQDPHFCKSYEKK